jgi:hypothetical protein
MTLLSATRAICSVVLLLGAQAVSADGRFYASDYTPELADQRALIAFDGKRQVMLIESRISLQDGRPAMSLGWVVPVPNVPEIAVADPAAVRDMYRQIRHNTDPTTLPVVPFVFALLPFAYLYGNFLRRRGHPDATLLRSSVLVGLIGGILSLVSLSAPTPAGPESGVEVIKALQVGPLDAKVLRASSGAELVDWLKVNGFAYGERDVDAVEDYLRRRWLFVAAKLTPQAGTAFEGVSGSPPLVLSFPTKEALYPVALTAAGGQPLNLVLYVFALERVEPNVAMRVAFAGATRNPTGNLHRESDKAATALFAALKPSPNYLTKLTEKLDADKMHQDIRFTSAVAKVDFRDWTIGPMFTFWVGGAFMIGSIAWLLQLAGRGRWRLSGLAWFAISMSISWLLAALFLLGSAGKQYWKYRRERILELP